MSEVAYNPPDTAVEQDEDDDIGIEIIPYPDTVEIDEQRRAYVLGQCSNSDLLAFDPNVVIVNLQAYTDWLKSGNVPKKKKLEAVK